MDVSERLWVYPKQYDIDSLKDRLYEYLDRALCAEEECKRLEKELRESNYLNKSLSIKLFVKNI